MLSAMKAYVELCLRLVRMALLVVGPVFLLVSIVSAAFTVMFLRNSVRTVGTISSLTKQVSEEGVITYMPVFDFMDAHGLGHQARSSIGSAPPAFHIGDRVPVLYRRDNPEQAHIDTTGQIWGFSIGFAIAAVVCSLIGYALLRFQRWQERKGLSITPWLKQTNTAP